MRKIQYSPSLKVASALRISKERKLPVSGEVTVKEGDKLLGEDVIASTALPGKVITLNAANILGCEPEELDDLLKKRRGDSISRGELIGETPGLMGFFKRELVSPSDGVIENISNVTGQVMIREPSSPLRILAHVDGTVSQVFPGEGARITTHACFIQGIFGFGPEAIGRLEILGADNNYIAVETDIKSGHQGMIMVLGTFVSVNVLRAAVKAGVKGIIAGGIDATDFLEFYGTNLSGITGNESLGITLILTEGFGKLSMAKGTFDLLKSHAGCKSSIDGATQIRAGVIRPEIIIPLPASHIDSSEASIGTEIREGCTVRIVREPGFGKLAKVLSISSGPMKIDTESYVNTVELQMLNCEERMVLPKANVELV